MPPLFPNFIIIKSNMSFSICLVSSDISFRALVATTTQCIYFLKTILLLLLLFICSFIAFYLILANPALKNDGQMAKKTKTKC